VNPEHDQHELRRQRLYAEWRMQMYTGSAEGISAPALLQLWSRYKYVVLAHDQRIYRRIGPLLADLSTDLHRRAEQVLELVMNAMAMPALRKNHVNALQHVAGHLKNSLDENEKKRWQDVLRDYESGSTSLQVPAILLQEYLQQYGSDYIRAQCYPAFFLEI
jgi:uncharacterized protein YbgA (DUF1722 family)